MIQTKKGDLLQAFRDGEIASIGHGCNIRCRMASGIARQIAAQFVEAAIEDSKTIAGDIRKMGTFTHVKNKFGYIFNIYQQEFYGAGPVQVDYGALEKGLNGVKEFLLKNKVPSLGLPKIGAGLAGGDWSKIYEIISEVFKDTELSVTIYEL